MCKSHFPIPLIKGKQPLNAITMEGGKGEKPQEQQEHKDEHKRQSLQQFPITHPLG